MKTRIRLLSFALALTGLYGSHWLLTSATQTTPTQSDYLPLKVGERWFLHSGASPSPVVLEVLSADGNTYDVKFDNPWVSSVLTLELAGDKAKLRGLSMGGQKAPMTGDVYYDFSAREGESWKNSIGTLTVVSRHKSVKTVHGSYDDCIEIEEVNKQGNKLYWVFARGVGFVQFAEGKGAFVLDETQSQLKPSPDAVRAVAPSTPDPPRIAPSPPSTSGLLIAVANNPAPNEAYTPKTVNARFEQAREAGATYVYLSPKWNALEPQPNHYNFKDVDFQIDQATKAGLVLVCNLRVIDTNQRTLPADLRNRSFQDSVVKSRLNSLLSALYPRMHGRLRYMLIGNEVDSYFGAHKSEVGEYLELFRSGAATIKSLQPGIPVSLSTAFDGLNYADGYLNPLEQASDFLALTYYPLHPDFTVRDPGDVAADFTRMIRVANGRQILLQEVGYPSSPLNNSSDEKQARMYEAVFAQLRAHHSNFIGANFLFMSNLSESVVNDLARYYNLPNADRFKAYLRSLGMFDDQGQPKKSWQVFSEQAKSVGH